MIQKVAFTPQVNFKGIEVPQVDVRKKSLKELGLIYGSKIA
jgi:hypothetical protein